MFQYLTAHHRELAKKQISEPHSESSESKPLKGNLGIHILSGSPGDSDVQVGWEEQTIFQDT